MIIVFNLDRSRPTRRWRYTQGWTVFHLPSTPRSRPGALTSVATSPGSPLATTPSGPPPPSFYTHALSEERVRQRAVPRTSPPLRPFSPVRHSGVRHLQRGRPAAMAGGSGAPSLASSFACHHARARRTSSSRLFLRPWINWCPDSRSVWAVGINPTLFVGGENQHKSGSLTSWASFWGVAGFPLGVRPVGPTLMILGR